MKKLSLATIIAVFSISLVACTNSGVVNNSNNDSSINNGVNDSVDSRTSNKITIEQAKEIALKHAGLTKDQVSFFETKNDIDNGAEKYDIEFYYNGKEYDYEISVIDGTIIKYDNDIDENNNMPGFSCKENREMKSQSNGSYKHDESNSCVDPFVQFCIF